MKRIDSRPGRTQDGVIRADDAEKREDPQLEGTKLSWAVTDKKAVSGKRLSELPRNRKIFQSFERKRKIWAKQLVRRPDRPIEDGRSEFQFGLNLAGDTAYRARIPGGWEHDQSENSCERELAEKTKCFGLNVAPDLRWSS